jgi:tryptophanyl-tRNA synthetase
MEITLTGITTTGAPHFGNYVGAILPAIEASRRHDVQSFYFLADYHALVKCQDPALVHRSRLEVAATWLALGLDVDNVIFYAQTDVPEILELTWMLTCVTAKGLMNRAHAYKAAVADNVADPDKDPDKAVTMGLFCYPILMAADILMFKASKMPVGKDQISIWKWLATSPPASITCTASISSCPKRWWTKNGGAGRTGRAQDEQELRQHHPAVRAGKNLRKLIMRIKTNSLPPEAPKDPDTCTLFQIYQAFATAEEARRYATLRPRHRLGRDEADPVRISERPA